MQRLGNAVGEFLIAMALGAVLHEAHVPLVHALEIGVAAGREGTNEIERCCRLAIGLDLAMRIGDAGFGCEVRPVNDVTAIARQLLVALLLGRRGARFCELPGDAADFNDRLAAGVGQHDRHLQEDAEEVADVVGPMLGKALGAVAALQQEAVSRRNGRKLSFQFARFTGKHQRRKARKTRLDIMQSLGVGIFRHLQNGLRAPAIRRPFIGLWNGRHRQLLRAASIAPFGTIFKPARCRFMSGL